MTEQLELSPELQHLERVRVRSPTGPLVSLGAACARSLVQTHILWARAITRKPLYLWETTVFWR